MVATPLVLKKGCTLDSLTKWLITSTNQEKTTETRQTDHSGPVSVKTAILKQENNWSKMVAVATVHFKQVRNSVSKLQR